MINILLVILAAGVGGLAGVYLLMSINEARADKRLEDEYNQWANENLFEGDEAPDEGSLIKHPKQPQSESPPFIITMTKVKKENKN